MADWYYDDYGTKGPFTFDAFKKLYLLKKITDQTLVWTDPEDKRPYASYFTAKIKNADRIILTTAPTLEGYKIIETLEIITAECVFGMNILRDIFAAFTDIFGGRSEASQNILRDARKTCLNELKREAALVDADAVIAVKLDYSEFSGGGKSMLFLVASGTAVRIDRDIETPTKL